MMTPNALNRRSKPADVMAYLQEGTSLKRGPSPDPDPDQDDDQKIDDYYAHSEGVESCLYGAARARLGLGDQYTPDQFRYLFNNTDADGERIVKTARNQRVPAWDLCFNAPKSVSVVWGIANETLRGEIARAHDEAVRAAIDYIETCVPICNSGRGSRRFNPNDRRSQTTTQRELGRLIAALHRHHSSRELDMHIHTHALVFNVAERASDGKIMALANLDIFRRQKEIGAVYRAALASRLRSLGFDIERVRDEFEISGISPSVRETFSNRRKQIVAQLARYGANTGRAGDMAAILTRRGKQKVRGSDLHRAWREIGREVGITPDQIEAMREGPEQSSAMPDHDQMLDFMTERESVFTHNDMMRMIAIQAQGITDDAGIIQYQRDFLHACNLVPLINDRGDTAYTSKQMLGIERRLAAEAMEMAQASNNAVASDVIDQAIAQFQATKGFTLTAQQLAGIRHITEGSDIALIQGDSGVGKSTLLQPARMAWEADGRRIRGAIENGVLAEAFSKDTDIETKTVTRILMDSETWTDKSGRVRPPRDPILRGQVIVVDEAGQIDSRAMAKLIKRCHTASAKLILVGDVKQLQPIQAGGPFNLLQHRIGYASITEIRRQTKRWQKEAVRAAGEGDSLTALKHFHDHGHLHIEKDKHASILRAIENWDRQYEPQKPNNSLLLANTRADVATLNSLARDRMRQHGHLGEDVEFEISDRDGHSLGLQPFAPGDRVIFTRGNQNLGVYGVKNGYRGTILAITLDEAGGFNVTVELSPGDTVNFNTATFNNIDHAFATTVHKAQGMSATYVSVVLGGSMQDLHTTYVQLSRMRRQCDLFVNRESIEREMSAHPPTEPMIKLATKFGFMDADAASFKEVRDFLNERAYVIEDGPTDPDQEWIRDIRNLIQAMGRDHTKQTTLDWQVLDEVAIEKLGTPGKIWQNIIEKRGVNNGSRRYEDGIMDRARKSWAGLVQSARNLGAAIERLSQPRRYAISALRARTYPTPIPVDSRTTTEMDLQPVWQRHPEPPRH